MSRMHFGKVCAFFLLLGLFCIISISATQFHSASTESFSETIQDTLFSNNHQLTTHQYIISRHINDSTTTSTPSLSPDPFVYFPQQIYDLMQNTGVTDFDYASTQGQWDYNAWGAEYTGIHNHLDWESASLSTYTPPSAFTPFTASRNDQSSPQCIHSTMPFHLSPQPHGGKLHYSLYPLDHNNDILNAQYASPQHNSNVNSDDNDHQAGFAQNHQAHVEKLQQTHTAITSSLSDLFCSALSQIKFDARAISRQTTRNKSQSVSKPNTSLQYKVQSFLPIESLCTEHIVSLRRLLPTHSMIPSSTTLFHTNYVSFRVTTQFTPSSTSNSSHTTNNSNTKTGSISLTISLTYVKNITPHDQTHTKTTNIATTTREMHEIPTSYPQLDEKLSKDNSIPSSFSSATRPYPQHPGLSLSAFLRPHKPNTLYLQHQAYLHPTSVKKTSTDKDGKVTTGYKGIINVNTNDEYNFGAIHHNKPLFLTPPPGNQTGTSSNTYIIKQLLSVFNKGSGNAQQIEQRTKAVFSSPSNSLPVARRYDLANADIYLSHNFAIKGVTITNVPRWMCLFASQTSTPFSTTSPSSPPSADKSAVAFQNTCSEWVLSLFDPNIILDLTKPQFIHPTLPNLIQLYTSTGLYSIVVHRESYVHYIAFDEPTIFLTISPPTPNNLSNSHPQSTTSTPISSLSALHTYFTTHSIDVLAYNLIYTIPTQLQTQNNQNPNQLNAQRDTQTPPSSHHLLYPTAQTLQILSPSPISLPATSTLKPSHQLTPRGSGSQTHLLFVLSSLLSSLLSNNNALSSFEKIYIQSNHHLYWNLLAVSPTVTLFSARDVQQFQLDFLLEDEQKYLELVKRNKKAGNGNNNSIPPPQETEQRNLYWPLFNSPCSFSMLLVNAYNKSVQSYLAELTKLSKNNGKDVSVYNYNNFVTFIPRPMKNSLYFCQFYSLLPQITSTSNTKQGQSSDQQHQQHQQENHASVSNSPQNLSTTQLLPYNPQSLPQFYPTKYALFPQLHTTRYFSSLALDSTEFVINIQYSPTDVNSIPPSGTFPNIVPRSIQTHPHLKNMKSTTTTTTTTTTTSTQRRSLTLVKHQSTVTWQVGDLYFDQISISGRYNEVRGAENLDTSKLAFFETISNYFSNLSSTAPVSSQFITRAVSYEHQAYSHVVASQTQALPACHAFAEFIASFESNDKSTLQTLMLRHYDPRCIHLCIALGQKRDSPTTITSYFLIDNTGTATTTSDKSGNQLPTYSQVLIKVPITKALFRVSESHTDIARGVDIVAGETNLIIIREDPDNQLNAGRQGDAKTSTENESVLSIHQYSMPTTNTSMLVPYPDASMPFNATAVVSTIIAFTFGNIFNILFNSDHDFLALQHTSKINRLVKRFSRFRSKPQPTSTIPHNPPDALVLKPSDDESDLTQAQSSLPNRNSDPAAL